VKKETIIAIVLGVVMLSALAGIGFAVWKSSGSNKTTQNITKKKASPPSTDGGLNVGNNSGIGGGLDGNAQNLGSSQGVAGDNTTNNQKPNFSDYEKYKDEKSALYADIKKGDGKEVAVKNKVSIYYKGYLLNGEVFDNQWPAKEGDTPKPFVFEIGTNTIIPGLQQGLVGMKVGGKRLIIVPPAVGYGEKGQGSIPPDSVLVFEVDLLKVE